MTREEIRACVKKRREDASKIQAAEMSARICERIVAMADYLRAKRILCYAALPDEVQTGGLAQIGEMDLVLAPGVAFDREGNRLGYGKGYFDRLLKDCACPKVGLAYEMQMVDHVPEHQGDVPMDKVVTETAIYVRGAEKAD